MNGDFSVNFREEFFNWIDLCLSESIPESVIAYSFNLYEPYRIELIGSASFDLNDEDWACNEDFVPTVRGIDIPLSICAGNWEECLATMRTLIENYLTTERQGALVLRGARAVAIGFVDGNLEIMSAT